MSEFVPVTTTLCGFSRFFNSVLYKRIFGRSEQAQCLAAAKEKQNANAKAGGGSEGAQNGEDVGADDLPPDARISLALFEQFWREEIENFDHVDRFFRLVKKPENEFIEKVIVCSSFYHY